MKSETRDLSAGESRFSMMNLRKGAPKQTSLPPASGMRQLAGTILAGALQIHLHTGGTGRESEDVIPRIEI